MAIIQARRVESDESFDRKQVVRIPGGLYGGLFSWYSLPKTYRKYQSEEEEQKFFVGFVVTHDRTNSQLAHFSEAILTVRPKLFFDETTGMKSTYVSVLYALLGGKKPYEQIVEMEDVDLDQYVGRPAILMLEPNTKADKNGLFSNRIKAIEPADPGLIHAIKPLYQERQIEHVGEHGLFRLSHPIPAHEDAVTTAPVTEDTSFDELDNETPF